MVGTRFSQPNASTDTDTPITDDPSVPIEIRRLFIDGKDTMRGDRVDHTQQKVYHWRGAVYAITDDTPDEWLDQEPEKYKTKKQESTAADTNTSKNSKKRKSTSAIQGEAHDEDAEETRRAAKRACRSMPNVETAAPTRRSTNRGRSRGRAASTTSRARSASTHTRRRPSRPRATRELSDDDDESTLKFHRTGEDVRAVMADIAAKKEVARQNGLNVDRIPDSDTIHVAQPRNQPGGEPIGMTLTRDLVKMARLNGKIKAMTGNYNNSKGDIRRVLEQKRGGRETELEKISPALRRLYEGARAYAAEAETQAETRAETDSDDLGGDDLILNDAVDGANDERESQSQLESELNDQIDQDEDPDTPDPLAASEPTIRDSQQPRSEAEDIPTDDTLTSNRHDSATSVTPQVETPSSHTTVDEMIARTPDTTKSSHKGYFYTLPGENKGGQRLRWSIPDNMKDDRYRITKNLNNNERAESLIKTGRINGESKSARRRRVAREKAFIANLPNAPLESMDA